MIKNKNIHLIGIGGAGMSGIAVMLAAMGNAVSGSDIKESSVTERLKAQGITVYIGHHKSNISNPDVVIVSSVIRNDNVEYQAAINLQKEKKLSILKRAQALAMLIQDKEAIVVGGTHGKTSTTALIISIMEGGNLSPSYVIGGEFEINSLNSKIGTGNSFILEADESDGSIEYFKADIGIITNIEKDHLDYYGALEKVEEVFKQFVMNSDEHSCFYVCIDDPSVRKVITGLKRKFISFGIEGSADIKAENIEIKGNYSIYDFVYFGETIGKVKLNIAGKHNILNSLPALAIGYQKGISFSTLAEAMLSSFRVKRRLEVKYEDEKVLLIDDYAHHPTEIKVTLSTLRLCLDKRLITVFQPHRYTRLKFLFEEFCDAFCDADIVLLADVYSASEEVILGVSTENLYIRMKEKYPNKEIVYLKTNQAIINYLKEIIADNDIIAVLGAGDINGIIMPLKDFLINKVAC